MYLVVVLPIQLYDLEFYFGRSTIVGSVAAVVSASPRATPQSGGIGERCRSHVTGRH